MDRAPAEALAQFDREIVEWAKRIRAAHELVTRWPEYPANTLRYMRRLRRKHPSASHTYVFQYLCMVMREIGECKVKPDARQRRDLIRCLARLERRVKQLDKGL